MTVTELNKKIKAVNIELLKEAAVEKNKELIAQANRDQMRAGQDSTGKAITPEYASDKYSAFKKSIGSLAPTGTPDLLISGAFHSGLETVVESGQYHIASTDDKSPFLLKRYPTVIGLSKESIEHIRPITTRTFIELWKKQVGLS